MNNLLIKSTLSSTVNKYIINENLPEYESCVLNKDGTSCSRLNKTKNKYLENDLPKPRKRKKKKISLNYRNRSDCYAEEKKQAVESNNSVVFEADAGNVDFMPSQVSAASFTFGHSAPKLFAFGAPVPQVARLRKATAGNVNFIPSQVSADSLIFGSSAPNLFGLGISVPKAARLTGVDLPEMPTYTFPSRDAETSLCNTFLNNYSDKDMEKIQQIKSKKMQLCSVISLALMYSTNLKNESDSYKLIIERFSRDLLEIDPEFVLKVAFYAREELNIRSASNLLLAFSGFCKETRPYLEKYFENCIKLPSDLIEVADFFQIYINKGLINYVPAALRKVMKKTFEKFDEYQLAKYNKKKRKTKKDLQSGFTLKQLIRLLHIKSPAYKVMCIIGKKYPKTAEDFRKCGLSGIWDSRLAGKRMKLALPFTWETQIAAHGNKAQVWESLIDSQKLPYMAMLRNVRNMIICGISQRHHNKVLKHLENKQAVVNSRQLPLQFYEAHKVICKLEDMLNSGIVTEVNSTIRKRKQDTILENLQRNENTSKNIESYKTAVNKALEISAIHNLHPIPGKTIVMCDLLPGKDEKGTQLKWKTITSALMLGLMCLKTCEDAKMFILHNGFYKSYTLEKDAEILTCLDDLMKSLVDEVSLENCTESLKKVLELFLKVKNVHSEKLDNIVFLRLSVPEGEDEVENEMESFLNKYRQIVNLDLRYTEVNLGSTNKRFSEKIDHFQNSYLCGGSTELIRFLSEQSNNNQLSDVENIDKKFQLPQTTRSCHTSYSLPQTHLSAPFSRVPKWRSLRIFISSTFKDMHSERDLLIRYVMPELRRRAAALFLKIHEIDLRWGTTESTYTTTRCAELCLMEAQKCDIFIGMLGDRYGSSYDYASTDEAQLQWLKDLPPHLSVTELEIHAALFRKATSERRFFYFRNNLFLKQVPEEYQSYFTCESLESKYKLDALKSKILSSEAKVVNGYMCQFAGVHKGIPVLSGLENFAQTVLEDMWTTIKEMTDEDPDVEEEELHELDGVSVERSEFLLHLAKRIKTTPGRFLISGANGCGKTALAYQLSEQLRRDFLVLRMFIGLTPQSQTLMNVLQLFSASIRRYLPVSTSIPSSPKEILAQFPDILQAAVDCGRDFIMLIDGLDHLEYNNELLDILSYPFPQKFRLIVSASDSSRVYKFLYERQVMHIEHLSPLNKGDQVTILKQYLSQFGKRLDENSFKNQLLYVITKQESGLPRYLRMACDFLRMYASYENFDQVLKSLPTSVPTILQKVLSNLENEYGSSLVQSALTMLCIVYEGFDEKDLHFLLSYMMEYDKEKLSGSFEDRIKSLLSFTPNNYLSQITYLSLVHEIFTFAVGRLRYSNFSLRNSPMKQAVEQFYLNKTSASFINSMHMLLAAYFHTLCDPSHTKVYKTHCKHVYEGLLYHLYQGKCYQELANLLWNLHFLEALFYTECGEKAVEYFSLMLDAKKRKDPGLEELNFVLMDMFYKFLLRNMHIFQEHPEMVSQQVFNDPIKCHIDPEEKISRLHRMEIFPSPPNFYPEPEEYNRISTMSGFLKPITAAACSQDGELAALGSQDGYLKIVHIPSKKIIHHLKSHTSAINFICFAARNRICTASKDATLTIFSSEDFSEIAKLRGHTRCVTSCCSNSTGSILCSSSWDKSVRFWSLQDGRFISALQNLKCAVNCIAHHPFLEEVACALWNGNIDIWATTSLQRNTTCASYCGSVQAVAYTSGGTNIISSHINCHLIMWSREGLKLQSLRGHTLPVRSLSISAETNWLLTGSDDNTLKVWQLEAGVILRSISCYFGGIILLEMLSPVLLMVVFQNSDVWAINILSGNTIGKLSVKNDRVVCFGKKMNGFEKQPNEEVSVVVGTESGHILIANSSLCSLSSIGQPMKSRITWISYTAHLIVCATINGDIGIFTSPDWRFQVIYGAQDGGILSMSLYQVSDSCDTFRLISTGYGRIVKEWEIKMINTQIDLHHIKDHFTNHRDGIVCCALSSNIGSEEWIVTGSHDNNVFLKGASQDLLLVALQTSVVHVECSEKFVLGCGNDGSLALWSMEGQLCAYNAGLQQSSLISAYWIEKDTNGNFDVLLSFVDKDGSIKISKPLQKAYLHSLDEHSNCITSCCISKEKEIVSSSMDGTVHFWKINPLYSDLLFNHKCSINAVLLSTSLQVLITSDVLGNIIVWRIDWKSPIIYVSKKSYTGGFIKALSWVDETTFAAAVTQHIEQEEHHFVDVWRLETSLVDDKDIYQLVITHSHCFKKEILCIDVCRKTKTILAGFKSGDVSVITKDSETTFKASDDWIVSVKLMRDEKCSEWILTSSPNGTLKAFRLTPQVKEIADLPLQPGCSSLFTTAHLYINKEIVYSGDSEGFLKLHSSNSMAQKVHSTTITSIVGLGPYLFTSSLDKTIKVWRPSTRFQQICQLYCCAPITSLAGEIIEEKDSTFYMLITGSSSGRIEFFKFYPSSMAH